MPNPLSLTPIPHRGSRLTQIVAAFVVHITILQWTYTLCPNCQDLDGRGETVVTTRTTSLLITKMAFEQTLEAQRLRIETSNLTLPTSPLQPWSANQRYYLGRPNQRERSEKNVEFSEATNLVSSKQSAIGLSSRHDRERSHAGKYFKPDIDQARSPTTQKAQQDQSRTATKIAKTASRFSQEESCITSQNVHLQSHLDHTIEDQPEYYGWIREHRILVKEDAEAWTSVHQLGSGSLGVVDEVRRFNTDFPSLVRKRVMLPPQKRIAEKIRAIIREEAAVLSRLRHPNIITFIGSYEDRTHKTLCSYCLLMAPVGENDLERFLVIASGRDHELTADLKSRYQSWIRLWYADLASALAYMHSNGVRHQDIKRTNIIHNGKHVFFTDFSSSGAFKVGQTTSTANPARLTAMYAAPEALSERTDSLPRYGRSFDVFGLGCVFCDMLTVEGGCAVSELTDFLLLDGAPAVAAFRGGLRYSENVPRIHE
ncbi:kinase-like protein [Lizonia empirigonia]|nr:kinase-like protein [Lizonia empirigonia]